MVNPDNSIETLLWRKLCAPLARITVGQSDVATAANGGIHESTESANGQVKIPIHQKCLMKIKGWRKLCQPPFALKAALNLGIWNHFFIYTHKYTNRRMVLEEYGTVVTAHLTAPSRRSQHAPFGAFCFCVCHSVDQFSAARHRFTRRLRS